MRVPGAGSRADPLLRGAAVVAAAFGLLTIASGGTTLFGGEAARRAAWAPALALALAVATVAVAAAFGVHVALGGAYEMRTVAALSLRSAVWLGLAWLAWRRIGAVKGS